MYSKKMDKFDTSHFPYSRHQEEINVLFENQLEIIFPNLIVFSLYYSLYSISIMLT